MSNIWVTFAAKFIAKNFQNSPNLGTLIQMHDLGKGSKLFSAKKNKNGLFLMPVTRNVKRSDWAQDQTKTN